MASETSRATDGRGARASAGRPGTSGADAAPDLRQQILATGAAVLAERGYAGTSTAAIAELVGISQASLDLHFADKEQLLVELLETSVQPSLAFVGDLVRHPDNAAAVYALASLDVGTLLATPHNICTLYLAPEVSRPPFDTFRELRGELRKAYTTLVGTVDPLADAEFLGRACLQLVEMVIVVRSEGEPDPSVAAAIARTCLRVVGLTPSQVMRAADAGERLLAWLGVPGHH